MDQSLTRPNFDDFMKARENAARAYVTGRADLLLDLSAQEGPASFFAPDGAVVTGAASVNDANARGAEHFAPGGTTFFEVLESGSSDEYGYWVGYQAAKVEVDGKAQEMRLRVTEIFQMGAEGWKLIHRHASPAS
ncbi:YybH family protein [Tropicibacter sp. S64]|uniref:YybH family protein n=1 Tax=Tropicibacter sp. S64 TaxID=3415122 RepID=UPI003C7E876F